MNELHAIKLKIELGRKRMALQKENEALEKKKCERDNKGILYTSIDKQKEEKSKETKKGEKVERTMEKLKFAFKCAASAAAVLTLVMVSIHFANVVKDKKNKYAKFKAEMKPVDNAETLAACDFAKKFVIEFSSRGENGVSSLWSKNVDSETRSDLEVALRRLNPSEVSFNSVDRLPGMIMKVNGDCKGSPVTFLVDSSAKELSLRYVQLQM
ncbi:MAG TPA: hypothetical protein DET40_01550 [Lentisphaeria bacterium]|nr:MAG: hypothetical protein A2X45_17170 [Lentisphaerae bacterium GWF2_50_93]HCE42218.1 hypothetical protein [Lentisphaeria bacterium]